jgi:hypothetical protein
MLWISTGDVIREIGIAHGFVHVKAVAAGETWPGLNCAVRLAGRTARADAGRARPHHPS